MLFRLVVFLIALCAASPAMSDGERFVLATTTSTENSGLLEVLTQQFHAATGVTADVVAVGTGQALALGKRGDAAALLTHDREGELTFVDNEYGTDRRSVMYNDFVLIGPSDDPAQIVGAKNVTQAMKRIAQSNAIFLSRGDDSGTHRKELRLWKDTSLEKANFGTWYRETGAGMGQTLLTATEMDAYTLTDRGTWIGFAKKRGLKILVQEEPPLLNPYSSIIVTHSALTAQENRAATMWHEWLTGPQGRKAINGYQVSGVQLFFAPDGEN